MIYLGPSSERYLPRARPIRIVRDISAVSGTLRTPVVLYWKEASFRSVRLHRRSFTSRNALAGWSPAVRIAAPVAQIAIARTETEGIHSACPSNTVSSRISSRYKAPDVPGRSSIRPFVVPVSGIPSLTARAKRKASHCVCRTDVFGRT